MTISRYVLSNLAVSVISACLLLFLSGCAASNISHKKWAEGNEFHSQGYPKLTIKIDDDFSYAGSEDNIQNAIGEDQVAKSTRIKTAIFTFKSKDRQRAVLIKTESINEHNWIMSEVTFAGLEGVLEASRTTLNGTSYHTGIFAQKHEDSPLLVKVYTSIFGSDCRLSIIYVEPVDDTWLNPGTLSEEQIKKMTAYSQRADASFEVMPLAQTDQASSSP